VLWWLKSDVGCEQVSDVEEDRKCCLGAEVREVYTRKGARGNATPLLSSMAPLVKQVRKGPSASIYMSMYSTQESLAVLNESAIDIKCEIRSTRARHGICDSVNATA